MKGFERKNQLFSLCGLNSDYVLCVWEITVAVVAMVINHAELQNVVLNMERLNIAMSANNIRVKNINTLMIMILSSRINGEKQI